MDTTDARITFDKHGVCSHCAYYEREIIPAWPRGERAENELSALLSRIKASGTGKPYDCVLGISGGIDSSYLAVRAIQWGLRPLAVHVDAGWNSELAVRNIELMVTKLGLDLETVVVDWEEMQDLQLAFLRANVANQDIPQDHAFSAALFHFAAKKKVRYVLSGTNFATESILPQSWGYDSMDLTHLKAIHKRYGRNRLRTFPTISFMRYYVWMLNFLAIDVVNPLNLIEYNKEEAIALLETQFGWRYYGGKHYESRWTRFYQAHYLPRKFGYDKRKAHYSSLIVTGQMTRDEALSLLERALYSDNELAEDKAFVAKKLNLSVEELETLIDEPCVPDDAFPKHSKRLEMLEWAKGALHWARIIRSIPGRLVNRIRRWVGV
jgi:N-acetyl sugar amidotransferase